MGLAGQSDKEMKVEKIAQEWIKLMMIAKKLEITPSEIRHFLAYAADKKDHSQSG